MQSKQMYFMSSGHSNAGLNRAVEYNSVASLQNASLTFAEVLEE